MILVTGGAFQGKIDWVQAHYHIEKEDIADGGRADSAALARAKVVDQLHLLVKRWMAEGKQPAAEMQKLLAQQPSLIVVTDEIGSGIVPLAPEDRSFREIHGRLCCDLAGQAQAVIRVVCGIGTKIK